MWEFSVGLYMIDVWPDSLLLAAAYGVVESASTALFGPLVGQWVDKLTYKKVFETSIVFGAYCFDISTLNYLNGVDSSIQTLIAKSVKVSFFSFFLLFSHIFFKRAHIESELNV